MKQNFLRKHSKKLSVKLCFSLISYLWFRIHGPKWMRIHNTDSSIHSQDGSVIHRVEEEEDPVQNFTASKSANLVLVTGRFTLNFIASCCRLYSIYAWVTEVKKNFCLSATFYGLQEFFSSVLLNYYFYLSMIIIAF